jgi:hypothetical protein
VLGGGGGGQDDAGCWAVQHGASGADKGGQGGGVEVAEQVAEPVLDLDAVPDSVLLGAGQDRDRAGLLAVAGQGPVGVPVGPQDVGQHDCVQRIRLRPRDPVAFPVASGRKGVDRVDVAPGGLQAGDQQPPGGLDRDRDQLTPALALVVAVGGVMLGEHGQQLGEPDRVVTDPPLGDDGAVRGDQRDVVMVFGPVDPAGDLHRSSPLCDGGLLGRGLRRPNGQCSQHDTSPAVRLGHRQRPNSLRTQGPRLERELHPAGSMRSLPCRAGRATGRRLQQTDSSATLTTAPLCVKRGKLGAADAAGHTVMLCSSTDLSPRRI